MNDDLIKAIRVLASSDRPTSVTRIKKLKEMTGLNDAFLRISLIELQAKGYLDIVYYKNKIKRIILTTNFPQ